MTGFWIGFRRFFLFFSAGERECWHWAAFASGIVLFLPFVRTNFMPITLWRYEFFRVSVCKLRDLPILGRVGHRRVDRAACGPPVVVMGQKGGALHDIG